MSTSIANFSPLQKTFSNSPFEASTSVGATTGAYNTQPTIPIVPSTLQQNVGQHPFSTFYSQGGFHQPFHHRPGLRFKPQQTKPDELPQDGPGRRLRKNAANVRKHIDYISNAINHVEARLWQYSRRDRLAVQPDILYHNTVMPPSSTTDMPVDCVLTKFVRAAMNKVKCPVYSLCWTPEGKRLITGASSGEFTLWNGTAFNFETILQAHDVAIRAIKWSHNDQWMASADHDGFVKYWQPNMNNVHMFQAHKDEPIRSISFCPTDVKLATASDDATSRVWDFARCAEERVLRGHGADVRSVDWHPTKGLLATGSRDSQQPVKLWDAKTGQCLATLHDHKNSVMAVQWNQNGNWLLTGSRDHSVKLYDVRMMREVQTFRGHKKEVTSIAWHPVHEGLFVSGGGDGSLGYWMVNTTKELALLEQAHDQAVWALDWHPLGHILATGSNDNNTKFWARNRPGDTQEDIFGLTQMTGFPSGVLTSTAPFSAAAAEAVANSGAVGDSSGGAIDDLPQAPIIPGMGLDENIFEIMNRDIGTIPALGLSSGLNFFDDASNIDAMKKPNYKQPHPKKAHRQFERMWMVSRPSGGGGDDYYDYDDQMDTVEEYTGGFFNPPVPKTSLLGPTPPSSMLKFPPPKRPLGMGQQPMMKPQQIIPHHPHHLGGSVPPIPHQHPASSLHNSTSNNAKPNSINNSTTSTNNNPLIGQNTSWRQKPRINDGAEGTGGMMSSKNSDTELWPAGSGGPSQHNGGSGDAEATTSEDIDLRNSFGVGRAESGDPENDIDYRNQQPPQMSSASGAGGRPSHRQQTATSEGPPLPMLIPGFGFSDNPPGGQQEGNYFPSLSHQHQQQSQPPRWSMRGAGRGRGGLDNGFYRQSAGLTTENKNANSPQQQNQQQQYHFRGGGLSNRRGGLPYRGFAGRGGGRPFRSRGRGFQ